MDFQENGNSSNLTSLLAFYAYMMIGFDYDTYSLEGGTPYFTKAQNIATINVTQPGWEPSAGSSSLKNRYYLMLNYVDIITKQYRSRKSFYRKIGRT